MDPVKLDRATLRGLHVMENAFIAGNVLRDRWTDRSRLNDVTRNFDGVLFIELELNSIGNFFQQKENGMVVIFTLYKKNNFSI